MSPALVSSGLRCLSFGYSHFYLLWLSIQLNRIQLCCVNALNTNPDLNLFQIISQSEHELVHRLFCQSKKQNCRDSVTSVWSSKSLSWFQTIHRLRGSLDFIWKLQGQTAVLFYSKPLLLLFEVQAGCITNCKCIVYLAGLNLTESQLSPPTMKILNKIPSIKQSVSP